MNIYSEYEFDIKKPKGGFVDFGWYSGRQYFKGTFSEEGMIHPMCQNKVSLVTAIRFLLKRI